MLVYLRPLPLYIMVLIATTQFGCDEPEPEPAYITIDGVEEATSGFDQDDLSITEAWVFADGTFLGAYEFPARVPILLSGETSIEVRMGIRQNGILLTPDIYPFYAPVVRQLDLVPGTTQALGVLPVTTAPETQFALSEDFEPGRNRVFTSLLTGQSGIEVITQGAYQGAGSGRIDLDADQPVVEIATDMSFSGLTGLDRGNVWLEVTYRSDVPVVWGVVGIDPATGFQRSYDPGFNPSNDWNKIYFNLTSSIIFSELANYSFALTAFLDENGVSSGSVFLDNIKVLYL